MKSVLDWIKKLRPFLPGLNFSVEVIQSILVASNNVLYMLDELRNGTE